MVYLPVDLTRTVEMVYMQDDVASTFDNNALNSVFSRGCESWVCVVV